MNEFIEIFQSGGLIVKVPVFFVCGFIGMIVSYSQRWARAKTGLTWWQYMTGDKQAVASAIIKLLTACWIGGGFEYLDALSMQAIVNAGVLLGLAIPDKIDETAAKVKFSNIQKVTSEA